MRTILILTIAFALATIGFSMAAPTADAGPICVKNMCVRDLCPWYWGCGPCDPNTCCGPECAPP